MKALLIIAYDGYQDIEYGKTRQELEKVGIQVEVASTKLGEAKGKLGGRVFVDLLLEQVEVKKYDAIVFIGGPGAVSYQNDKLANKIIQETASAGRLLAAICIAPTVLAYAGVLKGKKATVWSSEDDKEPIKILENNGAEYLKKNVVVDGKIITANGPQAAEEFGMKIAENLNTN
jgi:protease I